MKVVFNKKKNKWELWPKDDGEAKLMFRLCCKGGTVQFTMMQDTDGYTCDKVANGIFMRSEIIPQHRRRK